LNNKYDIWFSMLDIVNKTKYKISEKYNLENIFHFSKEELCKFPLKLNENQKNEILRIDYKNVLDRYISYMNKNKIILISYKDREYPKLLSQIYDFPVYLYVRGNIQNLYGDNIAIVGSRTPSNYGRKMALKISKYMADRNVNVVSGLARGIDTYAHLGCLNSSIGKTIAVLGTGVSNEEVYPHENKKLFKRILDANGTIISEYKLFTKPEKFRFPLRNRIISGISKKIVVVEARRTSGSLITANFGLDQGRDIYAVPGNIDSNNSIGTNNLIKEGAYILNNFDDIFEIWYGQSIDMTLIEISQNVFKKTLFIYIFVI